MLLYAEITVGKDLNARVPDRKHHKAQSMLHICNRVETNVLFCPRDLGRLGLCLARMIVKGVLDRNPKVSLILQHI
jgi:hypothetical protein